MRSSKPDALNAGLKNGNAGFFIIYTDTTSFQKGRCESFIFTM